MQENKPKVTIVCVTYNHKSFIKEALESFVMQKTNFPYEAIIHDDASTDGTTEIIKEYEHKYPDIIKPIYQKENQWSKAKTMSKTFIYPKIQGEYVAFCEGDDYWTDENKLQKQVDFLEKHPDYSICFHPVKVIWEDKREEDTIFPTKKMLEKIGILDFNSLLKTNFIQTNSVVYRWRFHKDSYDIMKDRVLPGDWYLHLLHAEVGKIGYIDEVMSVYRRNSGGMWTGSNEKPEWFKKYGSVSLRFWETVEKQFNTQKSYEKTFLADGMRLAEIYLQNRDREISIKDYIKLYSYKIMQKLSHKEQSKIYKAHYKSYKLFMNWCKTRNHTDNLN